MEHSGDHNGPGSTLLTDLPCELLLEVFSKLSYLELFVVEQTCKLFKDLVDYNFATTEHLIVTDLPERNWTSKGNRRHLSKLILRCGHNLKTLKLATINGKNVLGFGLSYKDTCSELAKRSPLLEDISFNCSKGELKHILHYASEVTFGPCMLKCLRFPWNASNFLTEMDIVKKCPKLEELELSRRHPLTFNLTPLVEILRNQNSLKKLSINLKVSQIEDLVKLLNASPQLESIAIELNAFNMGIKSEVMSKLKLPKKLTQLEFRTLSNAEAFNFIARHFRSVVTSIEFDRIYHGLHVNYNLGHHENLLERSFTFSKLRSLSVKQLYGFRELSRHDFPALEHLTSTIKHFYYEELDCYLIDFLRTNGHRLKRLDVNHSWKHPKGVFDTIVSNCTNLEKLNLRVLDMVGDLTQIFGPHVVTLANIKCYQRYFTVSSAENDENCTIDGNGKDSVDMMQADNSILSQLFDSN